MAQFARHVLGRFVREFSHHAQPPAIVAPHPRKGDLLPIHPSCIKPGSNGITAQNIDWVKLCASLLNFNYCTGWTRPICVPMDMQLSENQCVAVAQLARVTDANVISAKELPGFAALKESLNSKKFDYSGSPIEYMEDLAADRVLPTGPRPGKAGIRCITEFLTGEAKAAMENPQWKLPYDLKPAKSKKSLVRARASDKEWFKICQEGYKRGMFCMVQDKDVPRDKAGHLVNGARGVHKLKVVNGVEKACQRFISVLTPTNEILRELPGKQDTLTALCGAAHSLDTGTG